MQQCDWEKIASQATQNESDWVTSDHIKRCGGRGIMHRDSAARRLKYAVYASLESNQRDLLSLGRPPMAQLVNGFTRCPP